MSKKTDRTLGWATKDGEIVQVCSMDDRHLLNCIALSRRRIAGAKLATGVTSLSYLAYQYLVAEAKDRGIYPEGINDSELES